jgi:NAD(P)-dependent dehydrogenase (short-subunit alcohol dehydrogenase family)
MGRRVAVRVLGLDNGAAVTAALNELSDALGGIDVLIVAADLRQDSTSIDLEGTEWSRLANSNLGAGVFACAVAAKAMASRGPDAPPGRIILLLPNVEMRAPAAYVSIRVAVASLVPALAREWEPLPLTVHGINLPAGLDDESSGAETAYVALRLATGEGDEKNGRVLRPGTFI